MTSNTEELILKIHQFLCNQVETNENLTDTAKESLTVAAECIEQAYELQKRPPSNELLNIYTSHKQQSTSSASQQSQTDGQAGANPAQLFQTLASTIFNQVAGGLQAAHQPNQQQQAAPAANTATPSAPPENVTSRVDNPVTKTRKKVTEAEKLAAESFKNQGNDFMKQDLFKEAYDCYTKAINIDDNNSIYYSNRAAASSRLGDHQAAIRDCEEAIEIDPTYSKAYGRMGLSYASMDSHQKAKEAYIKAVELDPCNESYRNNLKIAEEKLAEINSNAGGGGQQNDQNNFQENIGNAIRSMMNNQDVIQMALRSLQDPRMQSFFGLGANQNQQNQRQ